MRKKQMGIPRAVSARNRRRAAARAMLEALEPRQLLTVDLSGSFLSVPTRVFSGSSQAVTLSIQNGGTTKATGVIAISFYATADGDVFDPGTDRLLSIISRTLTIAAGHAQTINDANLPISGALVAGNYRINAVINSTGKIMETDESNNTVESPAVVVAQPDYNLVGSFNATPALPPAIVQGQATKATVKVLVTNSSGDTATISAGQKVLVRLFARPVGGATDGSADVPLTAAPMSVDVGGLVPGKSKTLTAHIQFPASMGGGEYDVFAVVDSGGALAETDETDNQTSFGHTIVVAPVFSDPAVTFDPATVIPADAVADGRKMPVKIDVENLGNVKIPAGQTSTIDLVLTGGGHTSGVQAFTVNLTGLAPGASKTLTLTPVIMAGLLDGAYTVRATLATTAPGNLTGNDSASTATAVTLGPAFFNLGVAAPTVTSFNPAVVNGEPTSGTVSVGVVNLSNTLLPAGLKVNIALALRPANASDNSSDIAIGLMNNAALGNLAQGATKTVKVNATIPATLPNGNPIASGDYLIVATVTPQSGFAESTAADNSATGATVTVAAPFVDLAIVSATQNFFTPAAANSMAAGTVLLRNMGNVAVEGSITIQFFGTPAGSNVPSLMGTRAFTVNLLPGAVSPPLSEALTLDIPNDGLAATPVSVTARIDTVFVDANTGNNQLGAGAVIRSSQYVDLTILSASNPFTFVENPLQTGTGQVVIANLGSGVSSGIVTVTYEAISGLDNSVLILGSQTASIVLGLAQISAPIDVALTIPGNVAPGPDYTVKALISADITLDNNPNDNITTSLGTFSV